KNIADYQSFVVSDSVHFLLILWYFFLHQTNYRMQIALKNFLALIVRIALIAGSAVLAESYRLAAGPAVLAGGA
ncbi:MAG: hypothetical protein ACI4OE_06885, partial [Alphaproteobacteria bacterium]